MAIALLKMTGMADAMLKEVLSRLGGQTAVARALGITQGAVAQWDRVPANHLLRLEHLTGIPAARLRPDLAPASEPPAPP